MKGKGVVPATGETSGKHPGKGYSEHAFIDKNGVIHTSNVYDAQRALFEDRRVELKQPKMVSTLIKRLGETALEMAEGGGAAPTFNLCNVSIKGTNLFCADQIGIPRVEMPVIRASKTGEFVRHLEKQGYKVTEGREKSANLRASQSELSGEKVAASMHRIEEEGKFYKRIVVSKDDYILDGHHTWAGQLAHDAADNDLENDGRQVKIARIDIGIVDLIKEAEKWTGGAGKKAASEKAKGLSDKMGVWEEEKHPRVEKGAGNAGQFGTVGIPKVWQHAKVIAALTEQRGPKLDPKTIDVGGDEWNKALAVKLERQYQSAKPALNDLLDGYAGRGRDPEEPSNSAWEEPDEDKEYDGPPEPESWDMLSEETQNNIEEAYYDNALSDYVDSENQSWYDNGGALDQAKANLSEDEDWLNETVKDHLDEEDDNGVTTAQDMGLKFTALEISQAIHLNYESDGEGGNDVEVEWDDKLLHSFKKDFEQEGQEQFPGFEKQDYSKLLTDDQREIIAQNIIAAFDKAADKKAGDEEPPDFSDSAKEYMQDNYQNNMSDDEKYEWAKYNTGYIKEAQEEYEKAVEEFEQTGTVAVGVLGIPKKFDPLNTTSGEDYKKTQAIARAMSIDRTMQVLADRKIETNNDEPVSVADVRRLDSRLWTAWKASSTSTEGKLLQVATAAELNGRLNPTTGHGGKVQIDPNGMVKLANEDYPEVGGWAGIRAYVRAKWETTQFLLDKAGLPELKLYRGISVDKDTYKKANEESVNVAGHIHAPSITVVRNGAASTTFNPDVANGWSSNDSRIVLRALVPRTAAISVPAYGINVKSEQEVTELRKRTDEADRVMDMPKFPVDEDGQIEIDILQMEMENDLPHWLDPMLKYSGLHDEDRKRRQIERSNKIMGKSGKK
jgi:hypothetical protein